MPDVWFTWVMLIAGALVTGAALVGVLVSRQGDEPLFGVIGLAGFAASAWAFGLITVTYDRLDAITYAFVFALASLAGGYALMSTLLGMLASHRATQRPGDLPADVGSAAVLVLGEVEPPNYSPRETAAALDQLAEEGLLNASVGVLPFLFMAQKTRYRAAGGSSPGARQLESLAERLFATFTPPRKVGRVDSTWCTGERALPERVLAAVRAGFRTIIVAQAVVADSLEVDRAKRAVDAMRLEDIGVSVVYSEPLWRSERVAAVVGSQALAAVGQRDGAGVVLVGQGQPEERARECRSFDEQETAFLNRVRMYLADHGVREQNVRIAWSDWHGPDVTNTVRHLAALGCEHIVVSPTCFPLDSLSTVLDLPLAVRQARVDDSVYVVTLRGWGDDPSVMEALYSEVAGALAEHSPIGENRT
jgi:protoheme ferro-lyase